MKSTISILAKYKMNAKNIKIYLIKKFKIKINLIKSLNLKKDY